jgi:hypothetical protein
VEPEVPLRFRVYPTAAPKPVPAGRTEWPRTALVLHARLDSTGGLELGVLLETFDRWTVTEQLVFPGESPPGELIEYIDSHHAHTMRGVRRSIGLVPTATAKVDGKWDGLGYRLRDRGYRRGWPIVCAGLARQLAGVAERWGPARRTPGAWSFQLVGLGNWVDAPRIVVESFGQLAVAHWGSARTHRNPEEAEGPARRPIPRVGPFIDVLQTASALRGVDVYCLTDACRRFGVDQFPEGRDPIDRLRKEALLIARLYFAVIAEAESFNLSIDPATLISTGGVGTAILREAGFGR